MSNPAASHPGTPRRHLFRALTVAAAVGTIVPALVAIPAHAAAPVQLFVSTSGNDSNNGRAADSSVRTLAKAQQLVRDVAGTEPVTVRVSEGDYHLDSALALTREDSGTADAPVQWIGVGSGASIKGGRQLTGAWTPTADSTIFVTDVPAGVDFDELFVNDNRQVMARYPNYDESAPRLEGTTTLATLDQRSANWAKPTTGYVRAMHCHDWGSVSFTITGRTSGALDLRFVGDNNRPQDCNVTRPMNPGAVMVENIREELDANNEWFLDRDANKLYVKPAAGVNLSTADIEVGELDQLVTVVGDSPSQPISHVSFENFHFQRTHRTLFNNTFVNLSRGDWSVVPKGAAYVKNAEDISFTKSTFTDLGGNGVYIDGYNRNLSITASLFEDNGATDVHVVGSPAAVRNYSDNYFTTPLISDLGTGPKTEDYPRDILIEGNVMRANGRYEKQTSSVNISMSTRVTVRGNSLSDSPRACLNFSDTTWGGHLIADNDIFDCVRETGDNGSINVWGRSRFWNTGAARDSFARLADGVTFMGNTGGQLNAVQARAMMKLDTSTPITIDHNRFWHNGDWAIDLDDGSSNFVIKNNILLRGGIKLRDGFDRVVQNNLLLDGKTYEQVSYMPGGDVIEKNITLGGEPYNNTQNDPVRAEYKIGKNLFWNGGAPINIVSRDGVREALSADGRSLNVSTTWYRDGMDRDSLVADPIFASPNPAQNYDFTVASTSPALALGYANIQMTGFGAAGGQLPPQAVIPTGEVPADPIEAARRKQEESLWGGAVANITSTAEQSSYAISDFKGVRFSTVPDGSWAAKAGLRSGDLVRAINGVEVTADRNSFWQAYNSLAAGAAITLDVRRASTNVVVSLTKPTDAETLNNTSGVIYRSAANPTQEGWVWRDAARGGRDAWLNDIDATQNIGDSWELTFNGIGIDIVSQVNSDLGDVEISLDGKPYKTQSFAAPSREHQKTVLSISGLTGGVHTITGTMRSGSYMIVDAFKTHPAVVPVLKASVSTAWRCVAGKAVLTVTAKNDDVFPVQAETTTVYGKKTITNLAAGKSASQALSARLTSVPAGTVKVSFTATVGGKAVSRVVEAPTIAYVCP